MYKAFSLGPMLVALFEREKALVVRMCITGASQRNPSVASYHWSLNSVILS